MEGEKHPRKPAYESGPRILCKVVERVIARLEQRLSAEENNSESQGLPRIVDEAWRKTYGRPLTSAADVMEEFETRQKMLARKRRAARRKRAEAQQKAAFKIQSPTPAPVIMSFGAPPTSVVPATVGANVSSSRSEIRAPASNSSGRSGRLVLGRKRPRSRCRSSRRGDTTDVGDGNRGAPPSLLHNTVEEAGDSGLDHGSDDAPDGGAEGVDKGNDGKDDDESDDAPVDTVENEILHSSQENVVPVDAPGEDHVDDGDPLVEDGTSAKPSDYIITTTHVGKRRQTRGSGGWWKLDLEGGVAEGSEEVYAFRKCFLLLDKPGR